MKKSIVLLISLLFISALSILILKNLEDTNSYIKEQSSRLNKTQMITLTSNAQVEVSKVIKDNKESIDELLLENDNLSIPTKVGNSELLFTLVKYDKVDVNSLSSKDSKENSIEKLFNEYNISSFYSFKDIYRVQENQYKEKDNRFIKNSKQLDFIIDKFIKDTYSDEILDIKNKIGFINKSANSDLYELFIKINHLNELFKAYYILDKEGKVAYFESSFK
ncbi:MULTISPECIES: hypothetical protein [Arcobacteraceae]|uniref:Uncharacterized protein n=1 Tax=Poseidonibacter parvus TaxID=1850254 RepID=A0A1P8KJ34_9BACT|nr:MULTISPECIES: hypothetical protein [Arcobacteraceae]APW64563.1 hypothetical protein LPB137_01280 [Poseidonibacter parvus]